MPRNGCGVPTDDKKSPDQRLTRRARDIAELLAGVSNVTYPRAARESMADGLAWELGEGHDAAGAWNFGVSVRLMLGYSSDPRTCWQQIVQKNYPGGERIWRVDWLRAAGFLLDDGSENLPEAKRPVPGAKRRLATLVADWCAAHGQPSTR